MSTGPQFSDAVAREPEQAGTSSPVEETRDLATQSTGRPIADERAGRGDASAPDATGEASADAPDAAGEASADAPDAAVEAADPVGELAGDEAVAVTDAADVGGEGASRAPEGVELRGAIEAILLVIDEPVTATVLAQVVGVPEDVVVQVLDGLRGEYDDAARGFELRQIGGGWRLYTRGEYAAYVERFVLDGQQARLTQAALETLAVVAYRQPVSRSRVSAVRGVNVDGVMRTLVSRGLVEEAGSEEESGAILYRTTPYFLERLGLRALSDLPSLANFLPETTTIEQLEGELSSEGRDV